MKWTSLIVLLFLFLSAVVISIFSTKVTPPVGPDVYRNQNGDVQYVESTGRKFPATKSQVYTIAKTNAREVINAVFRYKAIKNAYPENIERLIEEGELLESYGKPDELLYSVALSSTPLEKCLLTVSFTDGNTILIPCMEETINDDWESKFDIKP